MINTLNNSHEGHLPIRVLQHNIIFHFENTTLSFVKLSKEVIKRWGLHPEIDYFANTDKNTGFKLRGPYTCNITNKICIQETFLAYLWCMSYSINVITSSLIDSDTKDYSSELDMAVKAVVYARSLIDEYSDWDKENLINPEIYCESDKKNVEITNEIFLNALNFILCHEFSHVESGHIEKANREDDLSDNEKIEHEVEADKKAIDLIVSGVTTGNDESVNIGITTAICALLYAKDTVGNKIHPDTDIRLSTAIVQLEVDGDDRTWATACASLKLWQNMYGIDIFWEKQNSFKDLFHSVSRQLE